MSVLNEKDLTMFSGLGIPQALLDKAGVERVSDSEARDACWLVGPGDLGGVLFPYYLPGNGDHAVYCRVRRDHPEVGPDGKPERKYLAPPKSETIQPHPYFPPVPELVNDAAVPIVLVEAEKSALALTAWSERTGRPIVAVALGGCYAWSAGKDEKTGKKVLHTDLHVCRDRRTFVFMDSNSATSENVQRARRELAAALREIGAQVQVLDLPGGPGINGPDDFVGRQGDDALASLFNDQKVGASALQEVEAFLRRFMIMSEAQYVATVLWIAHTHAIDACTFTPRTWQSPPPKSAALNPDCWRCWNIWCGNRGPRRERRHQPFSDASTPSDRPCCWMKSTH